MKRTLLVWFMALATVSSPAIGQPARGRLADLGWMAGDWTMTMGAQCIEEHWSAPSSNMLVGMSHTVTGDRVTSFEFLRIEARADGIFYVGQPGGRPPVDFTLSSEPGAELIFLNPGHADHLKRIIYRRDGDAGMFARIEGEDAGKAFAVDFPYRRPSSSAARRCGAVK
jgi:hypothetical protein